MKPIKNNPCDGCVPPRRTGDCHATCIDYQIARIFHEEEKAAEREKKSAQWYSIETARKNRENAQKRKRRFSGYNFPR